MAKDKNIKKESKSKKGWNKIKKVMNIKEDFNVETTEPDDADSPLPVDLSKYAKYETCKFNYKIV
jgi:hypothetical protein